MKLWLISQDKNNNHDTFDSAVVVAVSADAARKIHPHGVENAIDDSNLHSEWAPPADVKAILVGEAADNLQEGVVVCASFNAG